MLRSNLEGHTDIIIAVAFSVDGQLLASAFDDQTIRPWESVKGNQIQQLKPEGVKELSFSSDQTQLETNLGLTPLSTDAAHTFSQSLQLSPRKIQGNWLGWNGQMVLLLQVEFQPSCSAIRGNLIAIGLLSGRVFFLSFSQASMNEDLTCFV